MIILYHFDRLNSELSVHFVTFISEVERSSKRPSRIPSSRSKFFPSRAKSLPIHFLRQLTIRHLGQQVHPCCLHEIRQEEIVRNPAVVLWSWSTIRAKERRLVRVSGNPGPLHLHGVLHTRRCHSNSSSNNRGNNNVGIVSPRGMMQLQQRMRLFCLLDRIRNRRMVPQAHRKLKLCG